VSAAQLAGFGAVGAMVATPFVGTWVDRVRQDRRRRVARMIAAAEREGRRI